MSWLSAYPLPTMAAGVGLVLLLARLLSRRWPERDAVWALHRAWLIAGVLWLVVIPVIRTGGSASLADFTAADVDVWLVIWLSLRAGIWLAGKSPPVHSDPPR